MNMLFMILDSLLKISKFSIYYKIKTYNLIFIRKDDQIKKFQLTGSEELNYI